MYKTGKLVTETPTDLNKDYVKEKDFTNTSNSWEILPQGERV